MNQRTARLQEIENLLREHDFGSIRDLAEMFAVSQMTIRRDLAQLEDLSVVRLVYGGAVYNRDYDAQNGDNGMRYVLDAQRAEHRQAKKAIGRRAASLVEENDIIIVDSGTTTEAMVESIPKELPITILCYTANILDIVLNRPAWKLIMAGGYFHQSTRMFESPEALNLIERTRAHKAFIASGGIDDRLGATCVNQYETQTKKAVIRSSVSSILLADSSKFGKIEPSHYAELEEFEAVITDSGIPPQYERLIRELGLELYIADEE